MAQIDTSILDRHTSGAAEIDIYREDEYRAFGISRKAWGGEPMIDFISKCGNHRAIPYSQIDDISFNPSTVSSGASKPATYRRFKTGHFLLV